MTKNGSVGVEASASIFGINNFIESQSIMNTKVYSIFNKTLLPEAITRYFDLGKEIGLISQDDDVSDNEALLSLNRLSLLSTVQREDLLSIITLFHKVVLKEKRTKQIYAYLGEMICHWFLGEYGAVRKLQEQVHSVEYNPSWMERNGISGPTIASGIVTLIATFAGANPSVAGASAVQTDRMARSDSKTMAQSENTFKDLKNAICNINFNL